MKHGWKRGGGIEGCLSLFSVFLALYNTDSNSGISETFVLFPLSRAILQGLEHLWLNADKSLKICRLSRHTHSHTHPCSLTHMFSILMSAVEGAGGGALLRLFHCIMRSLSAK